RPLFYRLGFSTYLSPPFVHISSFLGAEHPIDALAADPSHYILIVKRLSLCLHSQFKKCGSTVGQRPTNMDDGSDDPRVDELGSLEAIYPEIQRPHEDDP